MRVLCALALTAFLQASVAAQQTGGPLRDYTVNGNGSLGTSAVSTTVFTTRLFENAYATADPAAPVVWSVAAMPVIGAFVTPVNSVDLDLLTLQVLGNGAGTDPYSSFFQTRPDGNFDFGLSMTPGLGGMSAAFAMAHVSPASPDGFFVSQVHDVSFFTPSVRLSATGPNSFNSVTTSGFWKVENLTDPRSIVQVILDWASSSNPAHAATVFHTTEVSMADTLDGGNNAQTAIPVLNCNGTYRNGSDLLTGLDYATTAASGCNPMAQKGFIPEDGIGIPPAGTSVKTLTFNFMPGTFTAGRTFELDADTDGGPGVDGAAMAGCVVMITFDDMTTVSGELAAVAFQRSIIEF